MYWSTPSLFIMELPKLPSASVFWDSRYWLPSRNITNNFCHQAANMNLSSASKLILPTPSPKLILLFQMLQVTSYRLQFHGTASPHNQCLNEDFLHMGYCFSLSIPLGSSHANSEENSWVWFMNGWCLWRCFFGGGRIGVMQIGWEESSRMEGIGLDLKLPLKHG